MCGVRRCVRVCMGMHRCAQVSAGVRGCVGVCECVWDEFSKYNTYWRIESLYQRTLICSPIQIFTEGS